MTIGLSIGLGGVGAPLLGVLADAHGLRAVFELIAVLPLFALVLSLRLPSQIGVRADRNAETRSRNAAVGDVTI